LDTSTDKAKETLLCHLREIEEKSTLLKPLAKKWKKIRSKEEDALEQVIGGDRVRAL